MAEEIEQDLQSQLWRLRNLYACRKEGSGDAIPFVPRPEQEVIFNHLVDTPNVPAYIVKSRRLGLSTGLNIFQVDSFAFKSGWRGTLIDLKQDDATKKMHEQIRFAYDSLPAEIRDKYRTIKKNDSEFRLALKEEEDGDDSVIWATINARGGDTSMLHVSEMGPMAAKDDARAREIVNGAFPAASKGRIVVETTWMGGKSGELWELIKPILENDPNADGVIYFFPWHDDPEAVRTEGKCTGEIEDYFRELGDKTGKRFTDEQKKWYAVKKLKHRHEVYREYPSTLEEALRSPVDGAIYAEEVDALRTKNRVLPFEVDGSSLVHTAWDLGAPVNTATWYFQLIGMDIRIVDVDLDLDCTIVDRVARILAKGYKLGNHLLPHDAKATPTSGRTVQQDLEEAGLRNTKIVPRTTNVWSGINEALQNFPRCIFNTRNCEQGIEHLENYRMEKVSSSGIAKEVPVHDRHSHAADAFRMIFEGLRAGLLVNQSVGKVPGQRSKVIRAVRR